MTAPLSKQEILDRARAFRESEIILAAHQLGVFDALGEGFLSGVDVAQGISASERGTVIILDALVGLGLLLKVAGKYGNTPVGRDILCRDGTEQCGHTLDHIAELRETWQGLPKSVKSGTTCKPRKDRFSESRERNVVFTGAMAEIGRPNGRIIAESVDLTDRKRLLDVGGGPGVFAEEILRRNPGMEAVIADLPITIEAARPHVEKGGFADRIKFQAADVYHDPDVDLGGLYDVVLISNILHMEGCDENRGLLKKVFRAMAPGGVVLIHEGIIDDDHAAPVDRTIFAINMLINTERGNCYSFNEMTDWLEEAGFESAKLVDCFPLPSLILAEKR